MNQKKEELGIVVVNYRTPANLAMCLISIKMYVDSFELVIVDNGEDEESKEVIEKFKIWKGVFYEKNIGFCKGVNKGVNELEADYFAIVPADCMVIQGWKEVMLEMAKKLPAAGIVGPMSTQCSGPQGIEARGMIGQPTPCQRIILNGAVMSKATFKHVGGLDEKFPNKGGNFSDDDLGRRYLLAGYKNYIIPALVFHNIGSSYQGRAEAMREDMLIGQKYFTQKWFKKG